MTIFLEIAKRILLEKVTAIRDASSAADTSRVNKALTMFGAGRDTELSADKRGLITPVLTQIAEVTDGENDAATCEQFCHLIASCIGELDTLSRAKSYPRGSSEPALENLIILLRSIFDELNSQKLLNIPNDADPLNVFRHCAASYYAQVIVNQHDPSMVAHLAAHPSISGKVAFTDVQKARVIKALHDCTEDLDVFDKKHARYEDARRRHTMLCMEQLLRDNQHLAYTHTPFSLLGKPLLSPDDGFLETGLKAAIVKTVSPAAAGTEASDYLAVVPIDGMDATTAIAMKMAATGDGMIPGMAPAGITEASKPGVALAPAPMPAAATGGKKKGKGSEVTAAGSTVIRMQ